MDSVTFNPVSSPLAQALIISFLSKTTDCIVSFYSRHEKYQTSNGRSSKAVEVWEPLLLISRFRGPGAANVEQNAPTTPRDITACRANQAGSGGAG